MKRFLAIVATCGLALSAHAGCYSVYNSTGRLIHQSSDAPVDTRQQYHMTVPQRFGSGSTLVYLAEYESCLPKEASNPVSLSKSAESIYISSLAPIENNFEPVTSLGGDGGNGRSAKGRANSAYAGSPSLQTGPRGGQFYINSGGNKSYVGGGGGRRR